VTTVSSSTIVVTVGTALGALWSGPVAAPIAAPPTLSASFELKTSDARAADVSSGTLAFLPGGDVCLWVTSPILQELRLSAHTFTIYYPDRDLALVATVSSRQAPPMLEPLVAGLVDPASALPAGSKLVQQEGGDGQLATRWRVQDVSGHAVGEMRAVERRDGAASIEVSGQEGRVQRRFAFRDRVRVSGGRSVPRAIDADYFAPSGAWQRSERWTLRDVAPFDGRRPAPSGCAKTRPTTKVEPLPW
jgi:hypothetical protein